MACGERDKLVGVADKERIIGHDKPVNTLLSEIGRGHVKIAICTDAEDYYALSQRARRCHNVTRGVFFAGIAWVKKHSNRCRPWQQLV
jgi:hypothetical protein